MEVIHRNPGGRRRSRAYLTPLRRVVTLAASVTLLAGVATALAPAANAGPAASLTLSGTTPLESGSHAQAVALSPDGTLAYTVGSPQKGDGPGTLSVIDTATGELLTTTIVGNDASTVAVSPDGHTVYVGAFNDSYSDVVYAVNSANSEVTGTIPVNGEVSALAVSPDGASLYVTTRGFSDRTGSLEIFNEASNELLKTVAFDHPANGVAASPDGHHILVTTGDFASDATAGGLFEIDSANFESLEINSDHPFSNIALSPNGDTVYATGSNESGGLVYAINSGDGTISSPIPVGVSAESIAVSPIDGTIYVASPDYDAGDGKVSAINSSSGAILSTVDLSAWTQGIAVSAGGSALYVTGYTRLYTVSVSSSDGGDGGSETETGVISGTVDVEALGGHSYTGEDAILVVACRVATGSEAADDCGHSAFRDEAGDFEITSLGAGDYYLRIFSTQMKDGDGFIPLIQQRYPSGTASFALGAGETYTAPSGAIIMKYGSYIHGLITDSVTHAPLNNIAVTAQSDDHHDPSRSSSGGGWYYTGGLPVGTYTLHITDPDGRYAAMEIKGIVVSGEPNANVEQNISLTAVGDGDTGNSGNTGNAGNTGSTGGTNTGTPTTPATPVKSEPVVSSVTAGGTASSASATKPSATTPVIASVTSPVAGNVSFTAVSGPVAPPKVDAGAYTMLGRSFIIEAPAATPNKPLSLDFTIDNSIMPTGPAGADAIVFRDGVAIPNCAVPNATVAAPDPCVEKLSTTAATTSIRVLSSHASTWTFGVAKADRVAGSNRYATAAALATQFGTANAIVVANGIDAKDGADALAANYLAGKVKAPIVLAQASRVEAETLAAVKSVLKGAANPTIYVMGGADSVSNAVANQIKAAATSVSTGTVTVKRVGGTDRYATAALATTAAGPVTNSLAVSTTGKAATTAILASGEVNADALAAGALSNAWGIPVLLTRAGQLPKPVQQAITSGKITQLIVLGGTDRVSQAVLDQAKTAGVTSTKRIAGTDRFDTSAQLYTFAMGTLAEDSGRHYGADGATVFLANGVTGFADALAVGPLAGKNGSALLTVRPNKLGSPATAFLKAHADTIDSVTGLGSTSTIIAAVLAEADGLV